MGHTYPAAQLLHAVALAALKVPGEHAVENKEVDGHAYPAAHPGPQSSVVTFRTLQNSVLVTSRREADADATDSGNMQTKPYKTR